MSKSGQLPFSHRRQPSQLRLLRYAALVIALVVGALPILNVSYWYVTSRKFRRALVAPDPAVQYAASVGWRSAINTVRGSQQKYMVIAVAFGLGNRLRALASAMAVAAAHGRRLLVVWPLDEHCNCSFRQLFAAPLPFVLLEEPVPLAEMRADPTFQVYSYMRGDELPGESLYEEVGHKRRRINVDEGLHLFVRSAFSLNHHRGDWAFARHHLRSLEPVAEAAALAVAAQLVADSSMVGLHVRTIFDVPRAAAPSAGVTGQGAVSAASSEYGSNESRALLKWRAAGGWRNFVRRIGREPGGTRFYLAADAEEAYDGLMATFPGRLLRTRRACGAERCDFRDAASIQLALVDMLNLARTQRILGSFYSSFSEAARFYGRADIYGSQLPVEFAGVDFGEGIDDVGGERKAE